ncbi:TPA: iron-hydroxamate ABC transporter substrate-binding protein [Bacillus thuringiensis]|uniref:iron-hydroxamate ABC transporter substrate-binding protein n=1 Tax=Bacillus TaxID=1386 RepID=UPI00103B3EFC|nr:MULTISPECIES: iron-hydroxamate ABC transporter substrate-binding protein [Bacillus]MBG0970902.1 iron-hydroxamate ABC transporter substrate-binding protein [Bacillus sp. SRB3LM]MBJ8202740.1 iron-hydroxamate ABC transporter substrate-binding protein [Bacillus cereus]MCU4822341.1 iron-hydroxamate ABC transporter substrate-binding protein [Bacillus cereus]MCU4846735.1 iron-hydroxamate ABC transporter substrate-binding protein [Bacillus cereus]MCU4855284.1 iron-hydroxamate ABC transporter substr
MKKLFISLTVLFVLVMSACSNSSTDKKNDAKGSKSEKITYQSENGKVEVPANPKRVVVLSSFAGNVMSLGVNLVGVDSWSKQNPRFESKLKDVAEVSDENVEKIAELNPDLIIGLSNIKNVDKLKKIAPTVTYTYGKVDYLTQHLEIGKLLNKEKEAKTWVDDFKKRAQEAGKEIKAKIGEDATVSVVENFNKQLYVYGENWGRGTEILYQEMKLKMPEKVKEKALKEGYYALSTEVLPEFAGDYLIVSKNKDTDNSFQETESYKNIPAVKNNRVYEANMMEFYFNDPLTLDFQLDFFKKNFLGK